MEEKKGSWDVWRILVLKELEQHSDLLENLTKENIVMKVNLTKLNIYATICGFIGGIVATIILMKVF